MDSTYIDSFDFVCRVNAIAYDERYTGKKLDRWYALNPHMPHVNWPFDISEAVDIYCGRKNKQKRVNAILRYTGRSSTEHIQCFTQQQYDSIRDKTGLTKPTSGLVALIHLLEEFSKVYVIGMDFYVTGQRLYYERKNTLGKVSAQRGHSYWSEYKVFRDLVEQGCVVPLKNYTCHISPDNIKKNYGQRKKR